MQAKRPYHHANLKQSLLGAAVHLLAEAGPQGFTLREVARRAGVSHNAPYRHFKDKDDLLAAMAAEGFDRLTASMNAAIAEGDSAADRLGLAGRGYVEFAVGSPQHLVVMFETTVAGCSPKYAEAGMRAFQVLLNGIEAVQAEGGLPEGDPHPFAVVAWAAVHGLAKLAIAGRLPFDATRTVQFTNYLSQAVLHGMANLPHPLPPTAG
ncbi:MAG TPA: TetR/AcrR family transcriptional regulator [Bryobacteraceae bacterium]|jgi:AcrR family transcriptional regulator